MNLHTRDKKVGYVTKVRLLDALLHSNQEPMKTFDLINKHHLSFPHQKKAFGSTNTYFLIQNCILHD